MCNPKELFSFGFDNGPRFEAVYSSLDHDFIVCVHTRKDRARNLDEIRTAKKGTLHYRKLLGRIVLERDAL